MCLSNILVTPPQTLLDLASLPDPSNFVPLFFVVVVLLKMSLDLSILNVLVFCLCERGCPTNAHGACGG